MMKRTIVCAAWLMLAAGFLAGCGDSVELRLQRTQIALGSGKPDQALEMAESVLREKPNDPKAMEYKARAQIQLVRLDEGRKTIEQIMAGAPIDAARQLMADWTFRRMSILLGQSAFVTDAKLQASFNEAMDLGQKQADWLEVHGKDPAAANYLRARYAEADAIRLQTMLKAQQANLKNAAIEPSDKEGGSEIVKKLQAQVDARTEEAEHFLKLVIDKDPRNFDALDMDARLLTRSQDWGQMWVLAQQVAKLKDIPVTLYERMTLALLRMPSSAQSTANRLDLGWKLQDAVAPAAKEQPSWKLTSARLHLQAHDYPKAEALLKEVIKVRPKDIDGRYLLGQALYDEGKYADAKEVIAPLAVEQRFSAQVLFLYGMTQWRNGDPNGARDTLRRSADLDPNDQQARTALVQLMAEKGGADQAGTEIDEIYQKDPTNPQVIRLKLQYLEVEAMRDQVKGLLGRVEKLSPLADEHVDLLVDGYGYLQQYDQAERWAQELVERRPDAIESHLKLAEVRMMLGKDEQVKKMLAALKVKFPNASSVNQMLGRLYLQRGSYDRANEMLNSVVESEPTNIDARLLYARSLASISSMDDALDQINKVLEQAPDDTRAHALAARIYQFMQQPEKVSYHLGKIDEKKIDERTSAVLLAQLKIRAKDYNEAAAICNRAIAAGNTDPTLRLLLADVYAAKHDLAQAETNLVALVRAQPNNIQSWRLLSHYYAMQKQVERGLNQLTTLQTLSDPLAEPLSRLAQASLLSSAGKTEDAIKRLVPIYDPLIRQRSRAAMMIADGLAKLHASQKDLKAAVADYEPFKAAGFLAAEASLRQADLMMGTETADQTVARLDKIAAGLTPDQGRLRYDLMNRYSSVNRNDRGMALLEGWLATRPNDPKLLRWKGEGLLQMGKYPEAITAIQKAIKVSPESAVLRERLVTAYVGANDFPAAEATLRDMEKVDPGARISALASLGQLYVGLGLTHRAAATFEELERAGRPRDPRLLFAIGQAYATLGRDELAASRLADVPSYAPQYASSQILLARLEQREGKVDDARKRLEQLSHDPQTAGTAGRELLSLDLHSSADEEMLRWSDRSLRVENLTPEARKSWLRLRVTLAARQQDWKGALDALDAVDRAEPDSPQVAALRTLLLLKLKRPEEALLASKAALKSSLGPLLALAMNQTPDPKQPLTAALPIYVAAMIKGDLPAARSALEALPMLRTLYRSDLLAITNRSDATSPEMIAMFREFAMSLVAIECGMPQLAEDDCNQIVNRSPSFAPAYGLLVQARLDQNKPVSTVLDKAREMLPGSSLALFLSADRKSLDKDYAGAVADLQALVQREPKNDHARYSLTQALQLAKQVNPAIEELQKLVNGQGPYRIVAANDLAYLLAENFPARREEANKMAQAAFKEQRTFSPLQDTVGWIEHLEGHDAVALKYLNAAIQVLSNSPEVQYHLGVIYQGVGNKTWSRYYLEEAAAGPAGNVGVIKARELLGK